MKNFRKDKQFIIAPKKKETMMLGSEEIDKCFLAEEILFRLESVGLRPYIYHLAFTGSIYIKFKGPYSFIGSLRVGDHSGIEKYRYKWNLRHDIDKYYEELDQGVIRRYYPIAQFDKMAEEMAREASVHHMEIKIL